MDFINLNSNRGVVNLFADFILKEINDNEKYDSLIEVTDCGKFFVVNGMTSRKEIVNLSEVNVKFKEKYKNLLLDNGYGEINVIDLIMYGQELVKKDNFWFTFYNTEKPTYNKETIQFVTTMSKDIKYQKISQGAHNSIEIDFSENNTNNLDVFSYPPLNISSQFPHGYSFEMGRNHYYYSEYVCNHLFNHLMCEEIKFKSSTFKNTEDDFDIDIISNSIYDKEKIKSLVLDVFDFNLTKFKTKILNYDYSEDVINPLSKKPWLVKDQLKNILIF